LKTQENCVSLYYEENQDKNPLQQIQPQTVGASLNVVSLERKNVTPIKYRMSALQTSTKISCPGSIVPALQFAPSNSFIAQTFQTRTILYTVAYNPMLQLPPHDTETLTLAYNPHITIATVLQTNTTPTCNYNKIVPIFTSVALNVK
jgi:hypothetical protein